MTWTQEDPTSATWSIDDPYSINTFLLTESGNVILQENGGRILLENTPELWSIDVPSSVSWTISNPS